MPATSSTLSDFIRSAMAGALRLGLAQISIAHGGVGADVGGRAGCDYPAIDQHRDAVGEREHRFHVVLDQEDGELLLQSAQHLHHAGGFLRPQARHRLVEQQHAGRTGERHGQLELAMFAMAQDRRRPVRTVAQAHPDEQRTPGLAQFRLAPGIAPEIKRMAGMRLHRQRHIVEHAEIEKQGRDLERARQPQRATAIHRQRGDVVTGETNAAGVGRYLAAELADQCGLAGAVRPDHRVQLAGNHVEREIVGSDDALEALGQVTDLQQRLAHALTLAPSLASRPSMPRRANNTTRSSNGPMIICQYSEARAAASPKNGVPTSLITNGNISSNSSSATAPNSGPNGEAMPPSTTMMMRSPERVQYMIPGLTKSV